METQQNCKKIPTARGMENSPGVRPGSWRCVLGPAASGRKVPVFAEQGLFFTDFCSSLKSCACGNTPLSQPVISGGYCF